jgi:hypothetical protein
MRIELGPVRSPRLEEAAGLRDSAAPANQPRDEGGFAAASTAIVRPSPVTCLAGRVEHHGCEPWPTAPTARDGAFGGGGQPISSDQSTGAAPTMALDAHYDESGPVPWPTRLLEMNPFLGEGRHPCACPLAPWQHTTAGQVGAAASSMSAASVPAPWARVQRALQQRSSGASIRRAHLPARYLTTPPATLQRRRASSWRGTTSDQISTYGEKAASRPMARASRTVKVSKRLGHKTDILYDETCNAAGSFRVAAQRADRPAC